MNVCVVIPMYNEEAIARHSLETIVPYTRQLPPAVTVLVVNDCSRDRTPEIVRDFIGQQPDDHVRMVAHDVNQGYGGANRTGIRYALEHDYDYVLFMDCDLTNYPKYLREFYRKMEAGCDYIKATRYSRGGGVSGVPWKRRVVSRLGNLLGKIVTGLPICDLTNGFRAVKTDILRKIELNEDHFSLIIEELMKSRKYVRQWCEVPYVLRNRSQAAKVTAFQYDFQTYWKYLKYLFIR